MSEKLTFHEKPCSTQQDITKLKEEYEKQMNIFIKFYAEGQGIENTEINFINTEIERVLPLYKIENNTSIPYNIPEEYLASFLQQSIASLNGGKNIISKKDAKELSARIVHTSYKGSIVSGTGFIDNGTIFLNYHTVATNLDSLENIDISLQDITVKTISGTEVFLQEVIKKPKKDPLYNEDSADLVVISGENIPAKKLDINLPGTYLVGTFPITSGELRYDTRSKKMRESLKKTYLWIRKVDIQNSNENKYTIIYNSKTPVYGGTSGSMIIHNGKIIGINARPYGGDRIILEK